MKTLQTHIPASSLIETIVAYIILIIVSGIFFSFISKVYLHKRMQEHHIAANRYINNDIARMKMNHTLHQQDTLLGDLLIEKRIHEQKPHPNLIDIHYRVQSLRNKTIFERNITVNRNSNAQ